MCCFSSHVIIFIFIKKIPILFNFSPENPLVLDAACMGEVIPPPDKSAIYRFGKIGFIWINFYSNPLELGYRFHAFKFWVVTIAHILPLFFFFFFNKLLLTMRFNMLNSLMVSMDLLNYYLDSHICTQLFWTIIDIEH